MRRILLPLNLLAVLLLLAFAAERYLVPVVAKAVYAEKYKELMYQCDHVMREHFIAKQMVLSSTTEETIRNLEAAEVGLTACHEYDTTRKEMIRWGLTENALARIGLEAIEERATDIRKFVEIHEIRY
ncbi:MAG: TIGR03982 family His-Xaa-Ser system protein [Boseongicola sp.]|nr:TIGR03982 family His-Xaa-Ser system protein [Boseongicola sp.]